MTIHWEELCGGHVLLSWLYEISPLDGGMTWHLHSLEGAFVSHAGVMNRWNLSPQSIPSGHSFALSTLTMDRQINWDSVPLIEINSLFTALPGFPLTPHSFKSMMILRTFIWIYWWFPKHVHVVDHANLQASLLHSLTKTVQLK